MNRNRLEQKRERLQADLRVCLGLCQVESARVGDPSLTIWEMDIRRELWDVDALLSMGNREAA